MTTLITSPGAYADIDIADYHRNPLLLPAPSLSSSGAKTITAKSPFHFWADSPMNPDRPPEDDKPHFSIGKAAHDALLLADRWTDAYHILPEGFAWNKTKAMPEAIAAALEAQEAGKTIIRHDDAQTVELVSAAIKRSPVAVNALTGGETELTLCWRDEDTGVWLRARPDFLPDSAMTGGPLRVVSDLKFMAATNCNPAGFSRAIANFGYHQSCAFYADGIKAIFGHEPTNWLLIAVEKDYPHAVSVYQLPQSDIDLGRFQNRQAIRRFADCLSKGTEPQHWPGYMPADPTAPIPMVGLPSWARKAINEHGSVNAATLSQSEEGE